MANPWQGNRGPNPEHGREILETGAVALPDFLVTGASRGEGVTPEPQIIRDIRGHDEFLADRRSEGHAAVELDRRERELLDAWDAQVEALAVLERQVRNGPGRFCDVCFTSSFSPCEESTPNAIPDVMRTGGFMVCDHCQLFAAYEKAERQLAEKDEALRGAQRTFALIANEAGGDNVPARIIRWAEDAQDACEALRAEPAKEAT